VQLAGAPSLLLEFDNECDFESGCDYLTIWADEQQTTQIKRYSGSEAKGTTLVVQQDFFWLNFHSDGSNTRWGWKINISCPKVSDTDLLKTPSIDVALWTLGLMNEAQVDPPAVLISAVLSVAVSTPVPHIQTSLFRVLISMLKLPAAGAMDWYEATNMLQKLLVESQSVKNTKLTGLVAELLMQLAPSSSRNTKPSTDLPLSFDRARTTSGVSLTMSSMSSRTRHPSFAATNSVYEHGVHMWGFELSRDELNSGHSCFGVMSPDVWPPVDYRSDSHLFTIRSSDLQLFGKGACE